MTDKFIVSSSPHIRAKEDTTSIMLDVIIALLPALAVAVYFFGLRALTLTLWSILCCVFFEWGYRKLMKKTSSIRDLSAAVTGMLLALCLPVSAPYWVVLIGAFFAIVIVKQLFGGIGKNFMNPALAARAFLFSFPVIMTTWVKPLSRLSVFGYSAAEVDAITAATPMASLHAGTLPQQSLTDLLLGNTGGSLGEICAIALIVGGLYLILRRVISCRIPLIYLGTVAVLTFLFPRGNDNLQWMLYNLLSGGLLLGAIFMATDYTTSPMLPAGQIIYAVGCGLLTVFIRYFGAYPEGVSYAILLMNACVWLIDKAVSRRRYGMSREKVKQ